MKKLERLFKALGNVRRLKIIVYLKAHPRSSVETIAEATKFSYKATSKHLGILFSAELVDREQRGYEMQYRIATVRDELVHTLIDLI